MLTARDIQKKEFTKTRSAGYSIEEVDQFLDDVAQTVAKLQSDKEELSSKAIALGEKLEKIRDEQEIWRKSIITTQRSYDEVMASAKIQAQEIIDKAKAEALKTKADMDKETAELQAEIEALKLHKNELGDEVENFKKSLLSTYEKHIALIRSLTVMKRENVVMPVIEPEPIVEKIPVIEPSDEPVKEPEEIMEPSVEDTQDTIVIPKDIFNDVADEPAVDNVTDEEIEKDVDEFLSKIDTSRVSFEKEEIIEDASETEDPEEPETVPEEKPAEKKADKKAKAFSLFKDDFDDKKKDDDEGDEEDDDEDDEEHESVLKNLFSGAFSSRKKKDEKKKRSRFFLGDDEEDDDEDDDFYDDDEE